MLLMRRVAEWQQSIGAAIPQITTLLSDNHRDVRKAGADALSKFAEHGKILNFLV
jgi:hypothetical protein